MPLTKQGREVLENMVSEYGAKKGREVFYASINKGKGGSDKWHKKYNKGGYDKSVVEIAKRKMK